MRLLPGVFLLLMLAPVQAQESAPIPRQRPSATVPTTEPAEKPAADAVPAPAEEAEAPPATDAPPPGSLTVIAPDGSILPLPRPRPDPAAVTPAEPTEAVEGDVTPQEVVPPRIYQTACPAVMAGLVAAEALPPISEGQCGLQSPLSITAVGVNGRMVPLSSPVTGSCGLATVLPQWVQAVDGYLWAHDNTTVESVTVGTSYMCRNVNNAATGNLSDHAFGDALDVVGFKLMDGRSISVLEGWPGSEEQGSRIVRYAHDAACSLFMTTLGPESNALHHDHLHLDLACHGKSCVARLCE
jgi:hypothetical protein